MLSVFFLPVKDPFTIQLMSHLERWGECSRSSLRRPPLFCVAAQMEPRFSADGRVSGCFSPFGRSGQRWRPFLVFSLRNASALCMDGWRLGTGRWQLCQQLGGDAPPLPPRRVVPAALNVSALECLWPTWAQPAFIQPKCHCSNFLRMQLSATQVHFCLLLCKAWASHKRPISLWITPVQAPTYASMIHTLWWGAGQTCGGTLTLSPCSRLPSCQRAKQPSQAGGPCIRPRAELFVLTWEAESFILFSAWVWQGFLLLFTLNDKTACDHVSGLMSAFHTASQKFLKQWIHILKVTSWKRKYLLKKTNVFYLTVYIFSICLLRLCNFFLSLLFLWNA